MRADRGTGFDQMRLGQIEPRAQRRQQAFAIRGRIVTVASLFAVGTLAVMLWAPTVGSTSISLAKVFDRSIPWEENVDAQIFFIARLPRVLSGAIVGARVDRPRTRSRSLRRG